MPTDTSLTPFFAPQGVVVLGASRDPTKLGYGLSRNLIQSGYRGAVHFVNPRGGRLFDRPIFAKIGDVPDPVDLAVLLVPPDFVPQTLEECGQRGIRAAIIATGGFKETGGEGATLENRCLEIARKYQMRLIGPNCIGLSDTHLPLDTTFLQPPPPPVGEISFISHSGAICAAVIDWIRGQGFGLSTLISLGNQADVNETDVLAPVAADPNTHVITLYMEGVSNGQRFVEQARQVSRQKPVVALKVGRYESGKRAAASHTGALAGQESAFDAAFQKAGVIRANTTLEMFQWARALAWSPLPAGRNVAVLTNAGGPGVTAADALELHGLKLAALAETTQNGLKSLLPAAASLHNPVDMLASASPEQYAESLRLLLADPGVDSVLIIAPPPPTSSAGAVAKAIIPVVQMTEKPVVVTLMGDRLIQEGVEFLRAARILEFRFPEESASALGVLSQRVDILQRLAEEPAVFPDIDRKKAAWLLASQSAGQFVDQETINGLFDIYSLPVLKVELADSPEKAAEIADLMGYPVVLKVASPDISHKSDVGGVLLNLRSADAVTEGYHTVVQKARLARPGARIDGVHIQRMLPYGQEVIVGVVQDPQFGALVMFGSGGVEVEGMKDVAFALAPLSVQDANRLLNSTWAGKKLAGFRSLPPADRSAVANVLLRLAQLAYDFPQLAEIEINPMRVLAAGQGAFAVDVRARLAG